jgi:hypothetical protein
MLTPMIALPKPVLHPDGRLTIYLPVPSRKVSPNASTGNSKAAALHRSRAVKEHKLLAQLTMGSAVVTLMGNCVVGHFKGYSLAHFFKTAAFRDDDNADGACKAYRDGICRALGIDDRHLRKLQISTMAKDAACPRLEVTLHP